MKKNGTQSKQKILWAVDPFVEDKSLQRTAAWALRALTKSLPAQIEPVYCLESSEFEVPLDVSSGLIQRTRELAEGEMGELLRRVTLPGLQALTILADPGATLIGRVDALLDHARDTGATLIVACTRARKGLARWMTGSFAETLMLRSDIPLFLVNPSWDRTTDFKHILFPTDFSDESHEAFGRVLKLASQLGSRVTVFHKMRLDLTPAAEVAFSAYRAYQSAYQEEVRRRQHEADRWAKEATRAGVKAEAVVDSKLGKPVDDAILKLAARKGGIIAMAAHSGGFSRAFLGSTTRKIARTSAWPLWILHPQTSARAESRKDLFQITDDDIMHDLRDHGRAGR